jgi:hypothetical protein
VLQYNVRCQNGSAGAGFTASDSSYQSPLLGSMSPVGHRAGLFAVARLCAFAGPLPHVSRNGSTVAAFAPRPLASEVPPSLVMSIMQITNKEMGSTFPRPHPRARHGEVCSVSISLYLFSMVLFIVKWLLGAFQNEIIRPQLVLGLARQGKFP